MEDVLDSVIKDLDNYSKSVRIGTTQTTNLFQKLLTDALKRATSYEADGSYFVKTGDIPAMWLRDATFQVLPYISLLDKVPNISKIIEGVIKRELRYVKIDPYANAFNQTASGAHWSEDQSNVPVSDIVWERKFEIDSLCAPLFLANKYSAATKKTDIYDEEFWQTVSIIIDVFLTEQHHESSPYFFKRTDCPDNDTLSHDGKGTPVSYTGLIWDGFRPSDNACEYGYHIPSNLFVISVLTPLLDVIPAEFNDLKLKIEQLLLDIKQAVQKYAIQELPNGKIGYAYEVDGLGNAKFMDDANVPSLLSLPFIDFCEIDDELYSNTRDFVLSKANPYYYDGKVIQGVGSNHTPNNYVWPISVLMSGLTSNNKEVKQQSLKLVVQTDNGTMECHESVDMNNSGNYTRDWFSWSNMTYCQLVLDTINLK